MALMSTLQDRFDTTVDKVTKWAGSSAGTTWDSVGRRAQLTCTTGGDTNLISGTTYDLTSSYLYAAPIPPSIGNGSRYLIMGVGALTSNYLQMKVIGNTLYAIRSVSGSVVQQTVGSYSSITHKWWRIREVSGVAVFEVSKDGSIWTIVWNVTKGISVTAINGYFSCGYSGTEVAANAYIDYVNMPIDIRPPVIRTMNAGALRASTR